MTQEEYAAYEQTVAEFIRREEIDFLSTGTWDYEHNPNDARPENYSDESWFSHYPCECCGTGLGGQREYLYATHQSGMRLQYSICSDCVYYLNYGRLDDMTMMEIRHTQGE